MARIAAAKLPIIDLSAPHRLATPRAIRQACVDYGFFYVVNHGVEEELIGRVFEESRKFFSLNIDEKIKLARREHRGYTPLYAEKLDTSSSSKGDSKESFYIGPLERVMTKSDLNQWPSEEILPNWRSIMESYYEKVMSAGKTLTSLIARALKLDKDYFEKIGAMDVPNGFLRLLHYPGEKETIGASAHSDYGMITLLATDSVPGLQICREKFKQPRVWEDVMPVNGAFIVNIGDMLERWTNCLFRSTLHQVIPTGKERYSLAFFLDPNPDCIVECVKTCLTESCPPKFPPIRSGDYLNERLRLTYGS